jgi:hypothetical protein
MGLQAGNLSKLGSSSSSYSTGRPMNAPARRQPARYSDERHVNQLEKHN